MSAGETHEERLFRIAFVITTTLDYGRIGLPSLMTFYEAIKLYPPK